MSLWVLGELNYFDKNIRLHFEFLKWLHQSLLLRDYHFATTAINILSWFEVRCGSKHITHVLNYIVTLTYHSAMSSLLDRWSCSLETCQNILICGTFPYMKTALFQLNICCFFEYWNVLCTGHCHFTAVLMSHWCDPDVGFSLITRFILFAVLSQNEYQSSTDLHKHNLSFSPVLSHTLAGWFAARKLSNMQRSKIELLKLTNLNCGCSNRLTISMLTC